MGYMRHHAIVVIGPLKGITDSEEPNLAMSIDKVRENVALLVGDKLLSPLVRSVTNGYASFFLAPDGSKEGWDESKDGDHARDRVIEYLETLRHGDGSTSFDYVEVQFGDDELETKIMRDSDLQRREQEKQNA